MCLAMKCALPELIAGPTSSAVLVLGPDGAVQTLSVDIEDSLTMQDIAGYLGFTWRFSAATLSVNNVSLDYASSAGNVTLAVAATISFPIMAIKSSAQLRIISPQVVIFSVSAAAA